MTEAEILKRYVASCFAMTGVDPIKSVEAGADMAAHWAALGAGIATFDEWKSARFGAPKLPAHDLSHVIDGGYNALG